MKQYKIHYEPHGVPSGIPLEMSLNRLATEGWRIMDIRYDREGCGITYLLERDIVTKRGLVQEIRHGFTQNLKSDFENYKGGVVFQGTYHHSEIITYGKDDMYATVIIHYEPKEENNYEK